MGQCWGFEEYGGNCTDINFSGVDHVFSTGTAFLALNSNAGTGQCWGMTDQGGDCKHVDFHGVEQVFSSYGAFLALNATSGQGQCWGESGYGGDCQSMNFQGVEHAWATRGAFIAINAGKACGPGKFKLLGGSECSVCPAGEVPSFHARGCHNCTGSQFAIPGMSVCSECPAGRIPNTARDGCEACPVGRFKLAKGPAQCAECLQGFVPNSDQTRCAKCEPSTVAQPGQGSCQRCSSWRLPLNGVCIWWHVPLCFCAVLLLALALVGLHRVAAKRLKRISIQKNLDLLIANFDVERPPNDWQAQAAATTSVWLAASAEGFHHLQNEALSLVGDILKTCHSTRDWQSLRLIADDLASVQWQSALDIARHLQHSAKEESVKLGISLDYVLSTFEDDVVQRMQKLDWRESNGFALSKPGFLIRFGGSEAEPPPEWRSARKTTHPNDPNFIQMASVVACGEHGLGFRKICPRDGRQDTSIVDGLQSAGKSAPANQFLSWVWGYKLHMVKSAMEHWRREQARKVPNFCSETVFFWWCFFCNNQYRMLEEKEAQDTKELAEVFGSKLQSVGRIVMLLDKLKNPSYLSGIVDHLPIILVISVAAAGPMHGAQTKCPRMEVGGELFRLWMQQRVTAPGRRLEVQQCLRGAAQFCFCIEGTFGGLRCYFLVCVGCEGGSKLLGFFCFDFCFGIGCLCVLEGCGGGFQETGDFEQAELCVLPLGGQTEIDGVPVDFGFPARPLGDPPDPGGGFGVPGRCGCWRPTWPQGLRGVRVGEASHPGPGGGGSAATRHRRHERKALVAIIEMLLAVSGIAGDDHPAKHQVAGIRGLLEVLREEPEDDDDEDGFLPPPWRKVTFDTEPVVQTFEAPGPMKPLPERKGGGKGGKVDKGAGKAPIAETKGGKHGERASSSSGDRRDKGGKKGGGKQAVPDSGKGKQPAAKAGPDSSKHGKLRQQDWQGTLIDYDKACAQLNSLSGAVVVPFADAEQADALSQMLLGAGTKCSARRLWQDSKGGITAPAVTEEGVAVLHFAHRDYVTAGVALPAIRGAPSSPKKVPATQTTTVMRIVFAKDLVTKDVWSAVARAPRAAVQKWGRGLATGSTESFVRDAWGFAQDARAGMDAVVGLVRVPVKASGGGGVFLEPAARDNLVKCGIEWIDTKEGETVSQAVARAKASAPLFGVFLGKRQVGMRVEAEGASQDNRVRFFSMKNTPASWSDDLVKEIIADQTALQQVSVHRKLTRNGRATWFLKARSLWRTGATCSRSWMARTLTPTGCCRSGASRRGPQSPFARGAPLSLTARATSRPTLASTNQRLEPLQAMGRSRRLRSRQSIESTGRCRTA